MAKKTHEVTIPQDSREFREFINDFNNMRGSVRKRAIADKIDSMCCKHGKFNHNGSVYEFNSDVVVFLMGITGCWACELENASKKEGKTVNPELEAKKKTTKRRIGNYLDEIVLSVARLQKAVKSEEWGKIDFDHWTQGHVAHEAAKLTAKLAELQAIIEIEQMGGE